MKLLRYAKNPILEPDTSKPWESGAVFNCGANKLNDGRTILLYRAIPKGYKKSPKGKGYSNYISSIGYATSINGYDFIKSKEPLIKPEESWERYGCEDPRITHFKEDGNEIFFITYTALSNPAFSGKGNRVAAASTINFKDIKKHGFIIPDLNDKDAVLFGERIRGKIVLLHRIEPSIQAIYFNSMEELIKPQDTFWENYKREIDKSVILKPEFKWESSKIGAGPPPVKTDKGWLLIYHGVDDKHIYRAGIALLDMDDPSRIISRSPFPILEPETSYEKYGDVNNVVFPEGALVRENVLFVYYGAADKTCCLATAKLEDVFDYLGDFKR